MLKPAIEVTHQVAVHGNSLKSLRPTWVYKLYHTESGTFLKNGITSAAAAEARYTRKFMIDKHMVKTLYPNRIQAYTKEAAENAIQRGTLNLNKH